MSKTTEAYLRMIDLGLDPETSSMADLMKIEDELRAFHRSSLNPISDEALDAMDSPYLKGESDV